MTGNTQRLGLNFRGEAWSDGYPITRVLQPDGSEAEGVAALLYVWDDNLGSFVKAPGDAVNGLKVQGGGGGGSGSLALSLIYGGGDTAVDSSECCGNIDGGNADSIFLSSQNADGGGA